MTAERTELTAAVVAAYVQNNDVRVADVPALVTSVFRAFAQPSTPGVATSESSSTPAVSIKASIKPEYLIGLFDGEKVKSLKPYLRKHGVTFEEYRRRFDLPANYPTTPPAARERRSVAARARGFGQTGRQARVDELQAQADAQAAKRPKTAERKRKAAPDAKS
jgi:predicted transcriptional regulator